MALKKNFFFKFLKVSGTLDQNLGPKYLKQFRPILFLSLSVIKLIFFENLVLCEWTELANVNLLWSTPNLVIVLHINLQIFILYLNLVLTHQFFKQRECCGQGRHRTNIPNYSFLQMDLSNSQQNQPKQIYSVGCADKTNYIIPFQLYSHPNSISILTSQSNF